jgi:ABC-type thiamin/hydroxymethylpyrimidine transport system permease subunit
MGVFEMSAIWGTLALAISGSAFAAYRYFAFKTGFCATTLSFNSPKTIEHLVAGRILPYIEFIYS